MNFFIQIGLSHPVKQYDFNLSMGKKNFYSIDEADDYQDNQRFFISEQEKKIIKMLYSSDIKSGVGKSFFIKKLSLDF